MKRELEEIVFDNTVQFNQIDRRFDNQFAATVATPNVFGQRFFRCGNSAPNNITNFLSGSVNQDIHILGDGFTTIVNGALIKTNTGANKLLAANKVYSFYFFNSVWVEHS